MNKDINDFVNSRYGKVSRNIYNKLNRNPKTKEMNETISKIYTTYKYILTLRDSDKHKVKYYPPFRNCDKLLESSQDNIVTAKENLHVINSIYLLNILMNGGKANFPYGKSIFSDDIAELLKNSVSVTVPLAAFKYDKDIMQKNLDHDEFRVFEFLFNFFYKVYERDEKAAKVLYEELIECGDKTFIENCMSILRQCEQ